MLLNKTLIQLNSIFLEEILKTSIAGLRTFPAILLLSVLALCVSAGLLAQQTGSRLEGNIADVQGKAVARALVTVKNEATGAVKVFKDLAEGLASRGVVVLRYDKRTRAYPSVTQSRDYTAETELIDDAVLAAGVLRAQPEVKPGRVFALGFGFGGYLLPRIAEADGKLAGMVIVNGNERPLEDVALDEAKYLDIKGPQMAVIEEQAAKIKKMTQADEDTSPLLGMLGPYLLDLKGYDPTGQAKLLKIPMLIVQGERDFQVNMSDFAAWKAGLAGAPEVTMKSYPALDHVLVEGTGKSAEADYRKPGQHVSQAVVDDIAKWLSQ